jgi:SUN domain-containing protein 1/2
MYEESESEDQDVTITASTQVRPPLSWKATLPRTPRVLSSLDSGVSSGSAGSSDEQRLGSPSDLPKHLYGLDKDDEVEVTHTTQYVYNKEKILTPPKVPPPPPVSPQPTLCSVVTQWVCCVLSVPYFAIVSLIAVDVTALDKLSSFLAVCTNPLEKKKSWFGLVVLILALLVFTWYLASPASPSESSGVGEGELRQLHSAIVDVSTAVDDMKVMLLAWFNANLTEVKAVTDRLAQKVSGIEKVLEGLHDDVGGMKSAVSAVEAALKVVKGELQSVDQSVQGNMSSLRDQLSNLTKQVDAQKLLLDNELSDLKQSVGDKLTREEATEVVEELIKKWLSEESGVFRVWLEDRMKSTVSHLDLEVFNKTLCAMIVQRAASAGGLTRDEVEKMISSSLDLYSADRVGMFDYALESAGGSIPSSMCSSPFAPSSSSVRLFGYTLWHFSNSARTVIQAGVLPGQCWAFPGEEGYVVIKLATDVEITHVTVEHIPKRLSPSGDIKSAPKNFGVLVSSSADEDREQVGNFTYTGDESIQTYAVNYSGKVVRFVEFKFYHNHGMKDYTCVYRLRVHGKMPKTA